MQTTGTSILERYFILPATVDRIRASPLAAPIERYVTWLADRRSMATTITRRVSVLLRFGDFARRRGLSDVRKLHQHVDSFVRGALRGRALPCASSKARTAYVSELRRPILQMLRVALPRATSARGLQEPLARWAPGLFAYLRDERGLKEDTVRLYRHYLRKFEEYVGRHRIRDPDALSPVVFDGFIAERRRHIRASAMHPVCVALRTLLRYLFREGLIKTDLSSVVEGPRTYRYSEIPRSIAWEQVLRTLKSVDRRSALGKRDYAILLLLAVYGLRAREVAAITLDDLEWRAATLHVRGRKAGNTTAYPLSSQVGDALLDYIRNGRPETTDRRIFMVARAPRGPITGRQVSQQAGRYLKAAGVVVRRLGSHTLRHSVAQRLVDADFSLKVVGDYLGHRSPSSTRIYGKVSIEALRELSLGAEEEIL